MDGGWSATGTAGGAVLRPSWATFAVGRTLDLRGNQLLTVPIAAELRGLAKMRTRDDRGADQLAGQRSSAGLVGLTELRTLLQLSRRTASGASGCVPQERFFPATSAVGRSWGMSSTPLTVSVPEESPDTAEDDGSVASDRAALVALYNATKGASWLTSTNWLSNRPLDQWHGVVTNSDGRVAELWLWANKLSGPIPAELGDLTKLQTLDLRSNRLTGPIPAELGALTGLRRLYLGSNELTGPIPAEAGRSRQSGIAESSGNNKLTGPIPA